MKKRLEAELISIAHRILKLKNKSEIEQLHKETRKLYETLSVLKFYEDNYSLLKKEISQEEIEEKSALLLEQEEKTNPVDLPVAEVFPAEEEILEETITEEEPVVVGEIVIEEDETEEEIITVKEDENNDNFKPAFELSFEEVTEIITKKEIEVKIEEEIEITEKIQEEISIKSEKKQITLHEIFGDSYTEPVFVKPNEVTANDTFISVFDKEQKQEKDEPKVVSLNDALSSSISVSLNDRVAFVKHLFNDSNEDYNRVLSQLNTFDTFAEAKEFLNEMVIPEYNYWIGKEEYLERFMEIVEKKFN